MTEFYKISMDVKDDSPFIYADKGDVGFFFFHSGAPGFSGKYEGIEAPLAGSIFRLELGKSTNVPDFVYLMPTVLACRSSLFSALIKDLNIKCCHWEIDVRNAHETYTVFRPSQFLNCMNWERSDIVRSASGSGLIKKINRFVFNQKPNSDYFALEGGGSLGGSHFVSLRFLNYYEESQFSGLKFAKVEVEPT